MKRPAMILAILAGVCVVFATAPAAFGQTAPPAKEPVANGKPLQYWIGALKDSEAVVREEAILVLTDLGPAAKNAVPALTPLLKDASFPVRVKAATALVRIDPRQAKSAVPVLCEAAKSGSPLERAQTVQMLGQLGAEARDACPTLIDALTDPDGNLQISARAALLQIGGPALPSLQTALTHKDGWVRRAAAEMLRQMGPAAKDATAALKERLKDDDGLTRVAAAQALISINGDPASMVPVLADMLKDKDVAIRRAAVLVLFSIQPRPKEALPIFTAGLQDADPRIRVQCAQAVWDVNHKADEVLPVLLAVLKDPKKQVAALDPALILVARIGPPARDALPPLLELLKTADPSLAYLDNGNTARALGALGAPAIPPLAALLADKDTPLPIQRNAVRALGAVGPEGAAELVKVLEKGNAAVRPEAAQILGQMGPAGVGALPSLLEMAKSTDINQRATAINALSLLGLEARPAAAILVDALKDPNLTTALNAAQAFRNVQPDPKTTIPALRDALKGATPQQRYNIADAMITVDPADETVLPTLLEMLDDKAWSAATMNLFSRMGPHAKGAVPALIKIIETGDLSARQMALLALQKIGPEAKAAVPALLELIRTVKNANLRMNAVQALKLVGAASKETVAALHPLVEGQETDLWSRLYALEVLAQCGTEAKDEAPLLVEMLKHTDPQIRSRAAAALVKVDPEHGKDKAVPVLEEFLAGATNLRGPALTTLLTIDPDNRAARDAARTMLKDPQDFNRVSALEALGQAGPDARKLLPDIREVLKNAPPYLRSRAAQTLWKIDKQLKDEAVAVLLELVTDKDLGNQRIEGIFGLGNLGADAKKALPALLEARKDPALGFRSAVNEAIKKIDPEAFARIGVPDKK